MLSLATLTVRRAARRRLDREWSPAGQRPTENRKPRAPSKRRDGAERQEGAVSRRQERRSEGGQIERQASLYVVDWSAVAEAALAAAQAEGAARAESAAQLSLADLNLCLSGTARPSITTRGR
jgi:hypothetical protein